MKAFAALMAAMGVVIIGGQPTIFICSQKGQPVAFDLIPKAKFEIVIPDSQLDSVIQTITEDYKTAEGQHGDGVIFVSTIDQAIRISTSEKGEKVIL